jgi:rhomboid family GlyGly-CTERM serine protease
MLCKSYANRMTNLSASLQWDRGRWIWLLGIVSVCVALLALGDSARAYLRYDRAAIEAGAWWRILSAHWVHTDAHHLLLNALGLVLVWALFAADYRPGQWLFIAVGGAIAIGAGLYWLSPTVAWYVGGSGLLHTAMAAGCIKHLIRGDWDRWILALGLMGKLAIEHGWPTSGVIADAHLYGAAAGALLGALVIKLKS